MNNVKLGYHPLPQSAACQTSSDGYGNFAAISFSICTRKNLTPPGNELIKCYTMNNVKLGYTTRYHNQLHAKLLQMDTVILLLFLSPFAPEKNPVPPRERTHQVLYKEQCEISIPPTTTISCMSNLAAISFSICTKKTFTPQGMK
jgi:hypothetical protein